MMLARWCSQPIKYRVQGLKQITERLQSISLKTRVLVRPVQLSVHRRLFDGAFILKWVYDG